MATEKSVMTVIRASRPSFRNNHDKIAFVVHASFFASGFVLTSTGPPAFAESSLSSSSIEEVGIEHWNEFDNKYAFVYVNPEKGNKKILVKCLVIGDKLLVDSVSEDAPEPVHLEIDVDEYVGENSGNNYDTQYKNLAKLVSSLDLNVLARLDGSSTSSSTAGTSRAMEGQSRNIEEQGLDVKELQGPQGIPPEIAFPPVHPVGSGDLCPGPGAGIYPTRPHFGSDGSMIIGPDDPRWFRGRGGRPGFPGGLGVPPGARLDPYGPPGFPGFEPNPFLRFPGRPGDIHPDLEQPGAGNGSDFI
ncbi:hypothetical protein Nepgr_012025 [Nepenthes gracilis]|uniref:PI31 proteasome regulator N-terminal domain-containing protein n=1 Tax=Nepenthes gracilis TaxID=150966 RepID=A0AAD3XMT1_NEPGR|nr:hypothetical protein Nepgr_012025 [Nepenthes gracilis]